LDGEKRGNMYDYIPNSQLANSVDFQTNELVGYPSKVANSAFC